MNRFRQNLKKVAKIIFRKDSIWLIQCRQPKEQFGVGFGAWDVATKGISKDTVVYSFGVGEDISFDIELIYRFNLTIHAFDPTPRSINWVENQQLPAGFVLHEYGLLDFDGEIILNPPENPEFVSHTVIGDPNENGHRRSRISSNTRIVRI